MTAVRRLVAALAALAVLGLAGCGPRPLPPGPEQVIADCHIEAQPTATVPLPRLQLFGNSGEHWAAVGDGCDLPVGLREVGVQLHLPPSLTEADVRKRVEVQGLAPQRIEWLADYAGRNLLQLSFPPGLAGQSWSVRLTQVPDARGQLSTIGLRLHRVAPARVTFRVRQDGNWQPLRPDTVLPTGPLTLRAAFSAPVEHNAVAAAFWSHLRAVQPAGAPRLTWTDDLTLQIDFPRLLGSPDLGIAGTFDANGLAIEGEAPTLRSGIPAVLSAFDLIARSESSLFPLPPQPTWVLPAASGRWLAVGTEVDGDPDPVPEVWAVDGRTGAQQRTDLTAASGWLRDDRLIGARGGRLALWDPATQQSVAVPDLPLAEGAAVAPDGNRVAFLRWGAPPATPNATVAADLLIYNVETQQVQSYANFVRRSFNSKPTGRDQSVHLAWAPDGTSVAALDTQAGKGESRVALVAMDLARGRVSTLLPERPGSALGTGIAYAADGRHILVGDTVWDLGLGTKRTQAVPVQTGPGIWSPDGRRLLAGGSWGPVYAVTVATGQRQDLGSGLAVGWLPDGRALLARLADAAGSVAPARGSGGAGAP